MIVFSQFGGVARFRTENQVFRQVIGMRADRAKARAEIRAKKARQPKVNVLSCNTPANRRN
jgi:hypothetical protein